MPRLPKGASPAILAVFLAVAGCSHPPPVTSLAGRSCADAIDVTHGPTQPLTLSDSAEVTLDDKAACAQMSDGGRSVFAAFRLPQLTGPAIISVGSAPLGEGLFSPHVLMLDGQGKVLREIPRDAFTFHGAELKALFRSHDDERYLLVISDPQSVGGSVQRLQETVRNAPVTNVVGAAIVTYQIYTGTDTVSNLTLAYNGKVTVLVEPLPKA